MNAETPIDSDIPEEETSALEKLLLRDLKLMKHIQVIHPVLQEVGLKLNLLDAALSIDLQYLGVRLPIPPPGVSLEPLSEALDPSQSVSRAFVSRTGKTTDVTQIKGWRDKFAPSESLSTPALSTPEAGPSSDVPKKNLSAFCSDRLDEYLENEGKLIDERAASFSQAAVEPVVYELPTRSTSYVRTLDNILKKQPLTSPTSALIPSFIPPSKRPKLSPMGPRKSRKGDGKQKAAGSKPNKPKPGIPATVSSPPLSPHVVQSPSVVKANTNHEITFPSEHTAPITATMEEEGGTITNNHKPRNSKVVDQKPSTPDAQKPSTPDAQKTSTPDAQKPSTPDAQKPSTPDAQKPSTPDAQKPSTPDAQKTSTPDTQKTSTPDVQKTSTPDKDRSAAKATGESSCNNVHPAQKLFSELIRDTRVSLKRCNLEQLGISNSTSCRIEQTDIKKTDVKSKGEDVAEKDKTQNSSVDSDLKNKTGAQPEENVKPHKRPAPIPLPALALFLKQHRLKPKIKTKPDCSPAFPPESTLATSQSAAAPVDKPTDPSNDLSGEVTKPGSQPSSCTGSNLHPIDKVLNVTGQETETASQISSSSRQAAVSPAVIEEPRTDCLASVPVAESPAPKPLLPDGDPATSFQENDQSLPFLAELSPLTLQLPLSPTFSSLDGDALSPTPPIADLVHFFSTDDSLGMEVDFSNTEAAPVPCPPPSTVTISSQQEQPPPANKPQKCKKKSTRAKPAQTDVDLKKDDGTDTSMQPNLEEVEEQLFVSFTSKEALKLHLGDTSEGPGIIAQPQQSTEATMNAETPIDSDIPEEETSALEKLLLRDLKLMKHIQVIHPVLQEVGLKLNLLDAALSIDLQYLGVRLPIPPPGVSLEPLSEALDPSQSVSRAFVSRTGKTTDVTQIKGWRDKFAPSESLSTPALSTPEAGPSSDVPKKNLSAFCSDRLDEYLENEGKLIDERAASFSQAAVEPVVYELPTRSTSYVRTLDNILKKQPLTSPTSALIPSFIPPSKRPKLSPMGPRKSRKGDGKQKAAGSKPNKPKPGIPATVSSPPLSPHVVQSPSVVKANTNHEITFPSEHTAPIIVKEGDSVSQPAQRVRTLWRKEEGDIDPEPIHTTEHVYVPCAADRGVEKSCAGVRGYRGRKTQQRNHDTTAEKEGRGRAKDRKRKDAPPKIESKKKSSQPPAESHQPAEPDTTPINTTPDPPPLQQWDIMMEHPWRSDADRNYVLRKLCEAIAQDRLNQPFWVKTFLIIPLSQTMEEGDNRRCIHYKVHISEPKLGSGAPSAPARPQDQDKHREVGEEELEHLEDWQREEEEEEHLEDWQKEVEEEDIEEEEEEELPNAKEDAWREKSGEEMKARAQQRMRMGLPFLTGISSAGLLSAKKKEPGGTDHLVQEGELQRLAKAREQELNCKKETDRLEVEKQEKLAQIESQRFSQQVKFLQCLGPKSTLITDGSSLHHSQRPPGGGAWPGPVRRSSRIRKYGGRGETVQK